jgi:methanethiol S-methyltransferase
VLKRACCLLIAVAAHLLLCVTVWYLYPFLGGYSVPESSPHDPNWWWIDLLLIAQFGVLHSLLLRPAVRNRLENWIPAPVYGCCYTIVTCCSLLLLVLAWRVELIYCLRLEGLANTVVRTAYALSWVALLYSLSLTGYGYQTGWTPFWGWLRQGQPPRRRFEIKGMYHLLRHPVYLSFLGQIWFTPYVTVDRLMLTLLLSVYIFIGSYFKDRRLQYYLGDTYRDYQARVPGYPFFLGPLGRVPRRDKEAVLQDGR